MALSVDELAAPTPVSVAEPEAKPFNFVGLFFFALSAYVVYVVAREDLQGESAEYQAYHAGRRRA